MAMYLSAGTATIAALMMAEHADESGRLPVAQGGDASLSAAALSISERGADFAVPSSFGHIGRRCERAVVTAYLDLRTNGAGDFSAFRACTTLYRIHHPEASLRQARDLVAEWIDHHLVRGDTGLTPGCECG